MKVILEDTGGTKATDVGNKSGTDVVGVTAGHVRREVTGAAAVDVLETVMTSLVLCVVEPSLSEWSHVAAAVGKNEAGLAGDSFVLVVVVSEADLVMESTIVMEVVVSEADWDDEESHVSVEVRDCG